MTRANHFIMNKGTQFMSENERDVRKSQLAISIAQGESVGEWARANSVPRATAYRWANEREFRKEVEARRRQSIDQAVDYLAKLTPWAAARIAEMAESADSELVRLRALRAIFADMMAASKYTGLEERVGHLEDRLSEQQGRPDSQVTGSES
jgi:hypothetical protein